MWAPPPISGGQWVLLAELIFLWRHASRPNWAFSAFQWMKVPFRLTLLPTQTFHLFICLSYFPLSSLLSLYFPILESHNFSCCCPTCFVIFPISHFYRLLSCLVPCIFLFFFLPCGFRIGIFLTIFHTRSFRLNFKIWLISLFFFLSLFLLLP